MNLKRREMPLIKQLPALFFNIDEVRKEFVACKFNDLTKYIDLNTNGEFNFLCDFHENTLENKFTYENRQPYKQLSLTTFNEDRNLYSTSDKNLSTLDRIKISTNKSHKNYNPILDERNYGKKKSIVTGIFEKILNSFKGTVTRARFAALEPGGVGKLHVDYDTDYSIRVHYPIFTNNQSIIGFKIGKDIKEYHLPSDGHFYFINQGIPHYIKNNGDNVRIHLVLSIKNQSDLY